MSVFIYCYQLLSKESSAVVACLCSVCMAPLTYIALCYAHPGRWVLYLYALPWGASLCLPNSFHHQQLDNKFYTHLYRFFHLLLLVLLRNSLHFFFRFVFNRTLPLLSSVFFLFRLHNERCYYSVIRIWKAIGLSPHLRLFDLECYVPSCCCGRFSCCLIGQSRTPGKERVRWVGRTRKGEIKHV